jgi:hypothetical protein
LAGGGLTSTISITLLARRVWAPPECRNAIRRPDTRGLGPRQRCDLGQPAEQSIVDLGGRPVANGFDFARIWTAIKRVRLLLADHGRQLRPGLPDPLHPQLGAVRATISAGHGGILIGRGRRNYSNCIPPIPARTGD